MKSRVVWLLCALIAAVFIAITVTVAFILYGEHAQPPPIPAQTLVKPTATRPVVHSLYETGIVFPGWNTFGYGATDTSYASGLPAITQQTSARWLEMPLLFKMSSYNALTLDTRSAPNVMNFTAGLRTAKAQGFSLFVVPLVTVNIAGGWAGSVHFHSLAGETAWFQAFWQTYRPYVQAAQEEQVEQLAIGTELEWMQRNAPANLWQNYISQVRKIFTGKLAYDTNWSDLNDPIAPWMRSLDTIGVSEYIPLISHPQRIEPTQMIPLFKAAVESKLDAFSEKLGKPIIVSELGYRNSYDALYKPWDSSVHTPLDAEEQAGAINVALTCLTADNHIQGTFFWGWHDTGPFDLENTQASTVIGSIYRKIEMQ